MGRVAGAYGVKGWLKVLPFTERLDALAAFSTWWVGRADQWQAVKVEQARVQGRYLVAQIAECTSPEAAEAWRGAQVAVRREDLPALAEGEYYWVDLEGAEVTGAGGERLGEIAEVFSNGAHPVLRVREQGEGGRSIERLIPFVPGVVLDVSLEQRRVRVAWERDW
jgi:16S rRNA processing protein RimM